LKKKNVMANYRTMGSLRVRKTLGAGNMTKIFVW